MERVGQKLGPGTVVACPRQRLDRVLKHFEFSKYHTRLLLRAAAGGTNGLKKENEGFLLQLLATYHIVMGCAGVAGMAPKLPLSLTGEWAARMQENGNDMARPSAGEHPDNQE